MRIVVCGVRELDKADEPVVKEAIIKNLGDLLKPELAKFTQIVYNSETEIGRFVAALVMTAGCKVLPLSPNKAKHDSKDAATRMYRAMMSPTPERLIAFTKFDHPDALELIPMARKKKVPIKLERL